MLPSPDLPTLQWPTPQALAEGEGCPWAGASELWKQLWTSKTLSKNPKHYWSSRERSELHWWRSLFSWKYEPRLSLLGGNTPKPEIPHAHFFDIWENEADHYPSTPQRLICGEGGARAVAFAGEVWESLSVNIVLAAFPMLFQIDGLGVVSAAGKAGFRPLCADISLKWDMNAPGEKGIVR